MIEPLERAMSRNMNEMYWPEKIKEQEKEHDGLKEGLSTKKNLRGPYEDIPGRAKSTEYHDKLTKSGE